MILPVLALTTLAAASMSDAERRAILAKVALRDWGALQAQLGTDKMRELLLRLTGELQNEGMQWLRDTLKIKEYKTPVFSAVSDIAVWTAAYRNRLKYTLATKTLTDDQTKTSDVSAKRDRDAVGLEIVRAWTVDPTTASVLRAQERLNLANSAMWSGHAKAAVTRYKHRVDLARWTVDAATKACDSAIAAFNITAPRSAPSPHLHIVADGYEGVEVIPAVSKYIHGKGFRTTESASSTVRVAATWADDVGSVVDLAIAEGLFTLRAVQIPVDVAGTRAWSAAWIVWGRGYECDIRSGVIATRDGKWAHGAILDDVLRTLARRAGRVG